jgi:formylmethanofuran dehydrogenase subunit B
VNLSRGYPRYNPGEHTTADLLARGEVDAALVIGEGVAEALPPPAASGLARVPTIVLAPTVGDTSPFPRVEISTAVTGISAGGTVCRMDDIPIPLRPSLASPYPTDEAVILRILAAVRRLPEWYPDTTGTKQIT